jgi:hypothetical protein
MVSVVPGVYGPEKAILDKSWRLPDIEMIG